MTRGHPSCRTHENDRRFRGFLRKLLRLNSAPLLRMSKLTLSKTIDLKWHKLGFYGVKSMG